VLAAEILLKKKHNEIRGSVSLVFFSTMKEEEMDTP